MIRAQRSTTRTSASRSSSKVALVGALLAACSSAAAEPIRLHPENPHYFYFRGKPTVLVTSADHYGSAINRPYNYRKSLDTLAAAGLNHARLFVGPYREPEGTFGIQHNMLAPAEQDYVAPWVRHAASGKYDLSKFNPEYFERIADYVHYAGTLGIVVEVTLFTAYYNDQIWRLSPLHPDNSLQSYGKGLRSDEVLALKDAALQNVIRSLTIEVVRRLREADNVYFEICNEPYAHGVTHAWQRDIATVIAGAEGDPRQRHLISQNIANHQGRVTNPAPGVSIFNFHYARPPLPVAQNWDWNKPVGLNETGLDGWQDTIYRIQGWDFLVAGGALYNNLDYSFTVGLEDGTYVYRSMQPRGGIAALWRQFGYMMRLSNGTYAYGSIRPGGGSPALRRQLGYLLRRFSSMDFIRMQSDTSVVTAGVPRSATARARSIPGQQYLIYIHHGKVLPSGYGYDIRKQKLLLQLMLPAGTYTIEWHDPGGARLHRLDTLQHTGGRVALRTPEYQEDLALVIQRNDQVAESP